ncbi:unnamed protein product [Rangifer tarandus platyrhynchus]|uniref:Uncharacterized protein n=1 Tax=Rangifer tarandus platyrhynchus TaxID=3082113 RepID=A0AC59YJ89_RANTA
MDRPGEAPQLDGSLAPPTQASASPDTYWWLPGERLGGRDPGICPGVGLTELLMEDLVALQQGLEAQKLPFSATGGLVVPSDESRSGWRPGKQDISSSIHCPCRNIGRPSFCRQLAQGLTTAQPLGSPQFQLSLLPATPVLSAALSS